MEFTDVYRNCVKIILSVNTYVQTIHLLVIALMVRQIRTCSLRLSNRVIFTHVISSPLNKRRLLRIHEFCSERHNLYWVYPTKWQMIQKYESVQK